MRTVPDVADFLIPFKNNWSLGNEMDQAQFREDANVAFRFLGKYGFHELPPEEGRQVDPFLVCFSDGITWVGVQGTNMGVESICAWRALIEH